MIRRAAQADAADIARVHVASWLSTYPGIVPEEYLSRMSGQTERFEEQWRGWLGEPPGGRTFHVAEGRNVGVVGFASGGPPFEETYPGYDAWLYTIYLLDEWRGHGLGRALISSVAEALEFSGNRSMLLWVMAENDPARRFYESLGGKPVGEGEFEIEDRVIREIAYGWDDLTRLYKGA